MMQMARIEYPEWELTEPEAGQQHAKRCNNAAVLIAANWGLPAAVNGWPRAAGAG